MRPAQDRPRPSPSRRQPSTTQPRAARPNRGELGRRRSHPVSPCRRAGKHDSRPGRLGAVAPQPLARQTGRPSSGCAAGGDSTRAPGPSRPRPGTPGRSARRPAAARRSTGRGEHMPARTGCGLGGRWHSVAAVTGRPRPARGGWAPVDRVAQPGRVGMQVDLRGAHRDVSEQFGDLVEAAAGIGQRCCRRRAAADAGGRPVQPGPARAAAASSSLTASGRIGAPIGSRNRLTSTKSTRPRPRHSQPLELVGVERLHHQEIQRHHPLPAGLGPRPVRVVLAAHHMQVRPRRPRSPAAASPAADAHRSGAARTTPRGAARPGPSAARSAGRAPTGRPATTRRSPRRWPGPPASPARADGAGPASATPSGRPRRGPARAGHARRRAHRAAAPDPPGPAPPRPRGPRCPAPRSAPR